jgi:hydroxymethylbilane synthase
LAVQARADDPDTRRYLQALEHSPTRAAVTAERMFLAGLGGGCALPVAALGTVTEGHLELQALVARPDGHRVIRVSGSTPVEAAHDLGHQLAAEAVTQGAKDLLQL